MGACMSKTEQAGHMGVCVSKSEQKSQCRQRSSSVKKFRILRSLGAGRRSSASVMPASSRPSSFTLEAPPGSFSTAEMGESLQKIKPHCSSNSSSLSHSAGSMHLVEACKHGAESENKMTNELRSFTSSYVQVYTRNIISNPSGFSSFEGKGGDADRREVQAQATAPAIAQNSGSTSVLPLQTPQVFQGEQTGHRHSRDTKRLHTHSQPSLSDQGFPSKKYIKQSCQEAVPGPNWASYMYNFSAPEGFDHVKKVCSLEDNGSEATLRKALQSLELMDLHRKICPCSASCDHSMNPLTHEAGAVSALPATLVSFREQEKKNPVRKKLGFFLTPSTVKPNISAIQKTDQGRHRFSHAPPGDYDVYDDMSMEVDGGNNSDSSSDLFEIDSVTAYLSSARSCRNI